MSFGIWELLVIFAIVALLFGTKKLRTIGGDLGGAVKGFRSAMSEAEKINEKESLNDDSGNAGQVINGEVETKEDVSQKI